MNQLSFDMPIEPPAPNRQTGDYPYDRLVRFIKGGRDTTFRDDMLVSDLNLLWDYLVERSLLVHNRLAPFVSKLNERIKAAPSRAEKIRLRKIIESCRAIEGYSKQAVDEIWTDSVVDFDSVHVLDQEDSEDVHEEFWMDVTSRPGIELTWDMTLSDVLTTLRDRQSQPQPN